jgi:hypothetical protein
VFALLTGQAPDLEKLYNDSVAGGVDANTYATRLAATTSGASFNTGDIMSALQTDPSTIFNAGAGALNNMTKTVALQRAIAANAAEYKAGGQAAVSTSKIFTTFLRAGLCPGGDQIPQEFDFRCVEVCPPQKKIELAVLAFDDTPCCDQFPKYGFSQWGARPASPAPATLSCVPGRNGYPAGLSCPASSSPAGSANVRCPRTIRGAAHLFCSLPLGVFQYGDLHLGHTTGDVSRFLGVQTCSHRSHWYPSIRIVAIPISISLQGAERAAKPSTNLWDDPNA